MKFKFKRPKLPQCKQNSTQFNQHALHHDTLLASALLGKGYYGQHMICGQNVDPLASQYVWVIA